MSAARDAADGPYLSLCGPVDCEDGQLVLRIPLDAGGEQLALVARGISYVDVDDLVIEISDWLAEKIGVAEGTSVYVDDRSGRLNITLAETQ